MTNKLYDVMTCVTFRNNPAMPDFLSAVDKIRYVPVHSTYMIHDRIVIVIAIVIAMMFHSDVDMISCKILFIYIKRKSELRRYYLYV